MEENEVKDQVVRAFQGLFSASEVCQLNFSIPPFKRLDQLRLPSWEIFFKERNPLLL